MPISDFGARYFLAVLGSVAGAAPRAATSANTPTPTPPRGPGESSGMSRPSWANSTAIFSNGQSQVGAVGRRAPCSSATPPRYRLGVGEARDNHVELAGSCDLSGFEPHNCSVHLILAE